MPSKCFLAPDKGPCENFEEIYYYNSNEGCMKFKYGGCDGNENKFKTFQDCERECSLKIML